MEIATWTRVLAVAMLRKWPNSGLNLKIDLARIPDVLDRGVREREESSMTLGFLDWTNEKVELPSTEMGEAILENSMEAYQEIGYAEIRYNTSISHASENGK